MELNLEIVPRSQYGAVIVGEGDRLEIVHFIGGGNTSAEMPVDKPFVVAGRAFKSRLIIGTGKYKTYAENAAALDASGAEMVTVAVRRVNLTDPSQPKLIDFIDPTKKKLLWRGWAKADFDRTQPGPSLKNLTKLAVDRILARFPSRR